MTSVLIVVLLLFVRYVVSLCVFPSLLLWRDESPPGNARSEKSHCPSLGGGDGDEANIICFIDADGERRVDFGAVLLGAGVMVVEQVYVGEVVVITEIKRILLTEG